MFARTRWYDPSTGTFLTPDPVGYRDSSNLYAAFGMDPVNHRDPSGLRAMNAQDAARLAMLKARGKKLHDDFTGSGRADFEQYLMVRVEHPWWDTDIPIGGDYKQQLVPSTASTEVSYEAARRSMVNDVATFEAAVARADANGEIYYVAGQGFTTITAADRTAADRSTMVAAGIFFATDAVPMILSPYAARVQSGGVIPVAVETRSGTVLRTNAQLHRIGNELDLYERNWSERGLDDAVDQVAGGARKAIVTTTGSGKVIYTNPANGNSVVYDPVGDYFRVQSPTGEMLDNAGYSIPANVSLIKGSKTVQTGVPPNVREGLTHFVNGDQP
ncbi:MAG: hypothetical protein JOZ54_19570 [Acidobacteria bacterium]|nr:hypothetical protein [Acidobacteriota bacterium]